VDRSAGKLRGREKLITEHQKLSGLRGGTGREGVGRGGSENVSFCVGGFSYYENNNVGGKKSIYTRNQKEAKMNGGKERGIQRIQTGGEPEPKWGLLWKVQKRGGPGIREQRRTSVKEKG